ncbi:MAG: hypothetical protein AAF327_01495 [Cyanobacteria bacterium P01_A01_bin.37]
MKSVMCCHAISLVPGRREIHLATAFQSVAIARTALVLSYA